MNKQEYTSLKYADFEKLVDEASPEQLRQWAIVGLMVGGRVLAKLLLVMDCYSSSENSRSCVASAFIDKSTT